MKFIFDFFPAVVVVYAAVTIQNINDSLTFLTVLLSLLTAVYRLYRTTKKNNK